MANDPETPSPDVMEVWREANEAASTEIVLCEDPGCRACLAAANVIAEAKARWEREAFEKAAQAGYVACAETRHVTLGDKVVAAIRALLENSQ